MTTIETETAGSKTRHDDEADDHGRRVHPIPVRDGDARFVQLAAQVGAVAADHAERHDRQGSFVEPAYEAMRDAGYLRLAVPAELGGLGASLRQVCYAQAELARHDGSAALAAAMHLYNTLAQVHRARNGAPDAEAVLRRVATDDLVIATSGGSDWLWPTTRAVAVDGGFRVSGRKAFCSQAPVADVITTCAVVGDPGSPTAEVLHFSVPLGSDGARMEETWDTLGMRGTASHDLVFDDVWVPSDRIVARRPWGEFGAPLLVAAIHFAPVVAATYFGIAAGARDVAMAGARGARRGGAELTGSERVQRQVGLMDARLRCAWWALLGALDELGDGYRAEPATLATVMVAKREVVTAAVEVVDGAVALVGGRAYYRGHPLERAVRDVRAGTFHPLTPEITLTYAGRLALGGPGDSE